MQVGRVDIILRDQVENRIELAVVLGNRFVEGEAAADEDAHHQRHGNGEG